MRPDGQEFGLSELLSGTATLVEAAQLSRLTALVAMAREVPFYADRLRDLPPEFDFDHWRVVPELSADDLRKNHAALLHPQPSEAAIADATAGAHGSPTPFFTSMAQRAGSDALARVHARWHCEREGPRIVVIDPHPMSSPTPPLGFWGKRRWHREGGTVRRTVPGVDRSSIDGLRSTFEALTPDIVVAPRSVLVELASRPLSPHRPTALISYGEPLHDRHRRCIEHAFGVPVFDRYCIREVGNVALECAQGNLHIASPFVRVEVVSERGVNVPGETGRVVVTPLLNLTAPLLRLAVGDVAIWRGREHCPCRSPLPAIELPLFPRQEMQRMTLPDGRSVNIGFFEHRLVEAVDVVQWQLVRSGPGRFRLRLQPRPDARDPLPRAVAEDIVQTCRDYLGRDAHFELEVTHRVTRSRCGRVEPVVEESPEAH